MIEEKNEDNSVNLKLVYRKKFKIMNFYPKSMTQLRDYFLSIFDQKSSGEFIFKAYPSKNERLTFEEGKNFNTIFRKIKNLKNPAIFIIDKDEEDYMNQIDKDNLKYIEEKLGFELQNIYKNYGLNQVKKVLDRKMENLDRIQKRVDLVNEGIKILINKPKIDEINNLEEANKNLQNKFNDIISKLKQLKESSM